MSQDLDQQVRQAVADFFRQFPRRYPVFSILLGIVILVLLIWYIPQWQVPAAGLSLRDRLQQINENRKTVAQIFGAGALALVGLYIAWVRSKAMQDQAEVTREQQLTDLYVKAIEQLGSEKLQIRLGGIYALERIARESAKDHWPIMEVLTAYLREHSLWKEGQSIDTESILPNWLIRPYNEYIKDNYLLRITKIAPDIQAIMTIIGRRIRTFLKGEDHHLNLNGVDLRGADLKGANLEGALLMGSHLEYADLNEANLRIAILFGSFLINTEFSRANLEGCALVQVNLSGASLAQAQLKSAKLTNSNLTGANLGGANMADAWLEKTCLKGANLMGVSGLTEEQIKSAIIDENTKIPDYLKIK
ncbi:MAG: pentapeptide repeat-containing protein [Desulfobaccales bacterium]